MENLVSPPAPRLRRAGRFARNKLMKLKAKFMILIVGLGNPGEEYSNTPHNMGFRVLDYFKEANFPHEGWHSDYQSSFLEGILYENELLLQKPLTFMNNSGIAVANLMKAKGISESDHLWVVHDELDLSWGRVKIDFAKNSAGHKGVESIINEVGTNAFWRFRIGIKPDVAPQLKVDIDSYLTLTPIPSSQRVWDQMMQAKAANLIAEFLQKEIRRSDFFFEHPGIV